MAKAALSLMLEADFLSAALPLFQSGVVDALEWSVDVGWGQDVPNWAARLLQMYSEKDALYAHGVHLSLLSGVQTPRQDAWLERVHQEVRQRRYVHLSEHFGWSTAGTVIQGAPLPLPFTVAALQVGRSRLKRLQDACGLPIGLENLALAMNARDVEAMPDFLDALLSPFSGFVVLDLHNLWCQSVNFDIDPVTLLRRYPQRRIRELHVSGGQWAVAAGRRFRRDTHDQAVPAEVLHLLDVALDHFPGVEVVVLERLGGTLQTMAERVAFAREFQSIRTRCTAHETTPTLPPPPSGSVRALADDVDLDDAQQKWLRSLRGDGAAGAGGLTDWVAGADPAARETAALLTRTWAVASA